MVADGALIFQEFIMGKPLPLATIHRFVLEYLRDRDDSVVFGAQAVNAYVKHPRMTQDVDIASTRAKEFADELKRRLNEQFHIVVRVRSVRGGIGYRVYQVSKPESRHLVDVQPVGELPPLQRVDGIPVVTPAESIAEKLVACHRRQGTVKAFTDRRNVAVMLLAFPELKTDEGPVRERLIANEASDEALAFWSEAVREEITEENDEDEFL